jgi:hypothetical protein
MSANHFGEDVASTYDESFGSRGDADVVEPTSCAKPGGAGIPVKPV